MYSWSLKYRNTNGANLLDPLRVIKGIKVTGNTGVTSSDPNYFTTDYIPVEAGTVHQLHKGTGITARDISYYDDKKDFVSGAISSDITNFNPATGILYAKVSFHRTELTLDIETTGLTEGSGSAFVKYYISRAVQPVYKKLSRGYDMAANQQYYREKLSGNLKLVRGDYDFIAGLPFDEKLFITIHDSDSRLEDYTGYFFKTDCKWNADDRIVEIKTKPYDYYDAILAGMEKTRNLIELAPELQEVELRRRPLIQVYIPGDTVVTNILGGTHWEQEIQTDPIFDHTDLTNTYKFYNTQNIRTVPASYASSLSTNITGTYDDNRLNANGLYELVEEVDSVGIINWTRRRYSIRRVSDNATLYRTGWTNWRESGVNLLPFNGVNGETGSFYFTEYRIYTRYYTDLLEIERSGQSPVSTYQVPSDDIVFNNSNYKRVIGYNVGTNKFAIYDQFLDTPTKYGRVPEGAPDAGRYYKEFLVAPSTGLSKPTPVSSSNWRAVSLWFFTDINIRYTEFIDGQDFTLRDAFPLHSVIQKLLVAAGSNVSFTNNAEHSEILYSVTNPLGGFSYLDFNGGSIATDYASNLHYFLTPKSNIISANYDQPALKAETTLGQVLKMMRDTFKIYWHVENGKLRLEHIRWYQNGGTYSPTPIIGTDLTQLTQPRNNKKWNFAQNKWDYDKESMPERFEYGWMDDVTPPFEGFNIDILSNYTQEGRVEDMNVGNFTTDLDFIQSNPQEVSKDGFALISTVLLSGKYRVPFIEFNLDFNHEVIMQNGFLSWLSLHPKYHIYDLPADHVNINNTDTLLFQNNTRQKKQEVTFPAGQKVNPYQLVKTGLGNGIVYKLVVDMQSYIVKGTIKHDTE